MTAFSKSASTRLDNKYKNHFNTLAKTLLQMVYPHKCRLCGRFTTNEKPRLAELNFAKHGGINYHTPLFNSVPPNICRQCLGGFSVLPPGVCAVCGCILENSRCPDCAGHPLQYTDKSMSLMAYDDMIGPMIKRFKYDGDLHLVDFLSLCLLAGLSLFHKNGVEYDYVVPVPLHKDKLKTRKFNQNELLMCRWPKGIWTQILPLSHAKQDAEFLQRGKFTQTQAGLNLSERRFNVADAFFVTPQTDLENTTILVIDDIITTGATVDNCAKALKLAGAKRVDALSIARTMPHLNPDVLMEI